jgi:hypothetical protein
MSRPHRVEDLLAEADGTVYLITRYAPGETFPGITLAGGRYFSPSSLDYIGGVAFETRRLRFNTAADRYVRPEAVPPKPLEQGYGPIAAATGELPPRNVDPMLYRFYVYEVTGPSRVLSQAELP